MNLSEIANVYNSHPYVSAVSALLEKEKSADILLSGLHGSGTAVVTASVFGKREGGILCMLNDLEDAGYFYNDLMQLMNGEKVFFFPSAYHRHIKYGHTDPASEILRTETLSLLQDENPSFILVTYPDAVAEKVLSREVLKDNTLTIHTGEKIDPLFVSEVLDSYGFEQTDYVYEPGQYAIRGSIIDIFSYSNEYPFRIDFFGDEIETIRRFDVETQLSINKTEEVHVIPKMSKQDASDASILDLLPDDTTLLVQDLEWCNERIESLWNENPVNRDEEGFEDREAMRKVIITKDRFIDSTSHLKKILLRSNDPNSDINTYKIQFDSSPQPLYQKN